MQVGEILLSLLTLKLHVECLLVLLLSLLLCHGRIRSSTLPLYVAKWVTLVNGFCSAVTRIYRQMLVVLCRQNFSYAGNSS